MKISGGTVIRLFSLEMLLWWFAYLPEPEACGECSSHGHAFCYHDREEVCATTTDPRESLAYRQLPRANRGVDDATAIRMKDD